jgi:Protein of unknown function (DUF1566)
MRKNLRIITAVALTLVFAGTAVAKPTPAQQCESGKNKEAGKYAYCRQKAESKYAITGDATARATAFQKCLDKYDDKWPKLEAKAAGTCPSTGDQTAIRAYLDTATTDVAAALAGGTLPPGSTTTTTAPPTTSTSTTTTTTAPPTTSTSTTTTTSSTTTTLRFVDNGDGTVTDHQTGLQWEKKVTGRFCLHCVDRTWVWSNSGTAPDGPAFTTFLRALNNCTSPDGSSVTGGFAGHCDWRLPGIAELNTIVDESAAGCFRGGVCIDPIFGPTAADFYWSSTPSAGNPLFGWIVLFNDGVPATQFLTGDLFVRAVRGGP